jgi:uncharacterized membrane protein
MAPDRGGWTEHQAEQIVGNLLRIGVLISALVVACGGVLYLVHYGAQQPHYHLFRGEPQDLRSVTGIVKDALDLRRRGLIQFGLLLLIATPIARVAFSVLVFLRQRDYTYIVVTLIVLSILILSLLSGRG